MTTFKDKIGPMGWGDPLLQANQNLAIERDKVESLPIAVLAQDATSLAGNEESPIVKLIKSKFTFDEGWDFLIAEEMLYRSQLKFTQNIGNCVGASHAMIIAARIAHEILVLGDPEEPLGLGQLSIPFVPYSYGVGRWVGGMLGGGDGSYCGAQIEGTMKYGFLPCFLLRNNDGSYAYPDLPQSSSTVGRLFGRSKTEIQKWTDKAIDFDLLEAPVCKTADDGYELVAKKHIPIQICSGWGFSFSHYDSKYEINIYKRSGSWSHSMQIVKAFIKKGAKFFTVRNQWGENAHKDGMTFTITAETFSSWVRNAEAIGVGAIKGLESNPGF